MACTAAVAAAPASRVRPAVAPHAATLLPQQTAYLCLTQLLDYKHELVLLLVNTLLSDLKNDNFVVAATALVVTGKLIGADLINAGGCRVLGDWLGGTLWCPGLPQMLIHWHGSHTARCSACCGVTAQTLTCTLRDEKFGRHHWVRVSAGPPCCAFPVLPHVIERLTHPRESVRKKAVMALLHFHQMDPDRSGPLAGEVHGMRPRRLHWLCASC